MDCRALLTGLFFDLGNFSVYHLCLLEKQVQPFLNDPAMILDKTKTALDDLHQKIGIAILSTESLAEFQRKLSMLISALLNDTLTLFLNLILLLFVLYYMLVYGKEIESYLGHRIPLEPIKCSFISSRN